MYIYFYNIYIYITYNAAVSWILTAHSQCRYTIELSNFSLCIIILPEGEKINDLTTNQLRFCLKDKSLFG